MHPTHHLERSQRYLHFVPDNVAAGDCLRAAASLARSASHAVTAAAVHSPPPSPNRCTPGASPRPRCTGRCNRSPTPPPLTPGGCWAAGYPASPPPLPTIPRLCPSRTSSPTPSNRPEPEPAPQITTIGQLREILGIPCDTAHANHPIECPGCRLGYNDPNAPTLPEHHHAIPKSHQPHPVHP